MRVRNCDNENISDNEREHSVRQRQEQTTKHNVTMRRQQQQRQSEREKSKNRVPSNQLEYSHVEYPTQYGRMKKEGKSANKEE